MTITTKKKKSIVSLLKLNVIEKVWRRANGRPHVMGGRSVFLAVSVIDSSHHCSMNNGKGEFKNWPLDTLMERLPSKARAQCQISFIIKTKWAAPLAGSQLSPQWYKEEML